ncbi:GH92 family glycosyl hydrolase [Aeoliella mucimassa]|uniref:Glycosyl hydrolase family 92 n=1 Tax=Aeoliella mucimassa TaxID=2527972 RepID=A0A518AQ17_9BACT|nr:GH92 family glycosyl hydrolase [Aeoliella mucimassa]QDU56806.1 Glycosyl hydrolase family 92 [Aeoliella mucimassa]
MFPPKTYLICTLLVLASTSTQAIAADERPVDLVNPQIDTHNSRWFYFSSACRPFGMVNLSPDTQTKGTWKSGYLYGDKKIRCFSHIHAWQLAGIPVMPTVGEFQGHKGMNAYQSEYSHDSEVARPGYHKVVLDRYKITAELTSTCRVGMHRYTFPASDDTYVLFDTGAFLAHGPMITSRIEQVNDREITGRVLMGGTDRRPKDTYVYFVAQFDKPFRQLIGWRDGKLLGESNMVDGPNSGAAVKFTTSEGEAVQMKLALSYTSIDGARKNLKSELPHWDFDRVRRESDQEWNQWLSRIQITGGTPEQRVKFYSDLWHALLGRRIVSDVDGSYCDMTGSEPRVRRKRLGADGKPLFPHYNFDALWGSHWSINILWSLVYPEVMDGTCETMVDMYRDGGLIPRGPSGGNYTYVMIGDPAVSFFACAYNKGIRGYDAQTAYEGLRKNAFVGGIRDHAGYEDDHPATGGGMKYYVERGYVPEGVEGKGGHRDGAAMTLEYAYQDWCLAQLAKGMGKQDDYEFFATRSQNYRKLWDAKSKLMRPREKSGEWIADFKPIAKGASTKGFCESNSMIYSNYVPHDMAGLIEMFGGPEAYRDFLNHSFEASEDQHYQAPHGEHASRLVDYDNQPGTAMAHLFNYCGAPWLSQKWVRKVKLEAFAGTTPYAGYNGDEDQGQMGALGVLMAIGLFEVDGGASVDPIYELTSPLFDRVTIQFDRRYYDGDQLTITTQHNSAENVYIQNTEWNASPLNRCWLSHRDVVQGGQLDFTLGPQPNKQWGLEEAPGIAP